MSAPSPPRVTDNPDSRNSTLVFYWKTPLSDGDGSGISSYTLNCTAPSSITVSYPAPSSEGIGLISSLTNRTRYFFDIFCTNSNGISSPFVSYFAKQPGDPPNTPVFSTSLFLFNGRSTLNVSWSTPTNDGGADIYRYGVWMYSATSNGILNLNDPPAKTYTYCNVFSRQLYLPSLTSNYYVNVTAINDSGWSDVFDLNRYQFVDTRGYFPGIRWNALPYGNYQVNGIYIFNTISSASTAVTLDGTNMTTLTNGFRNPNSGDQYCVEWTGFFLCRDSGSHTFYTESDDWSFLWLGSNAEPGNYTLANVLVNNGNEHGVVQASGTISLTSGNYYFIRFSMGENGGGDDMRVSFQTPTVSRTYNFSNYMYYRPT
jgi:hypothetical protein